jgi:hypothetical protein
MPPSDDDDTQKPSAGPPLVDDPPNGVEAYWRKLQAIRSSLATLEAKASGHETISLKTGERLRLLILQRRAQGYIARGMKSGNHGLVRRALRLLTVANERSNALGTDIAVTHRSSGSIP